jgi:hypothetical protein
MKRTVSFRAVLGLVLAAAVPAGAAEKHGSGPAPGGTGDPAPAVREVCPADDATAGPALRAFIDPETGQLRAGTPEEARALAAAAHADLSRAIEALQPVVHPDGMITLDLQGLFMQNFVAVRMPDGTLSFGCVEGPATAAGYVPPEKKPAPKLEEK